MTSNSTHLDGLEELRDLNRLFLHFICDPSRVMAQDLGISTALAAALRQAPAERLDALADLPRALFELDLQALSCRSVMDPTAGTIDAGLRVLQLTLLHSAWNLSRRSDYAAQLLMGLGISELRALRTTPVSDLLDLSLMPGLVRCAFRQLEWLWAELLAETRPERCRRLRLVVLQPEGMSKEQLVTRQRLVATL